MNVCFLVIFLQKNDNQKITTTLYLANTVSLPHKLSNKNLMLHVTKKESMVKVSGADELCPDYKNSNPENKKTIHSKEDIG